MNSPSLTRTAVVKYGFCLTAALSLAPQPALEPTSAAFKSAVNPILAQLQVQMQEAKKLFMANLQAFEVAVKGGLPASALAQTLFDACVALQTSVTGAGNSAVFSIAGAAQDALADLAGGMPLNGVYPVGFYSGTGGQWDKARNSVKSKVEKLYASLQGRIRKTMTVAESKGVTLTLLLTPPAIRYNLFFSENTTTQFTNHFDIDTVVAVNRSALAEDGEAWFAGVGDNNFGTFEVVITGVEADTVTTTASFSRWSVHATDEGSLFKKGNYIAVARQDNNFPGDDAAFSFR